jgi:aryl-alcohol dehydrogenase-like predicted oxidoreductase
VGRAFDGGINLFFFYGPGHASFVKQLALLTAKNRDEVIIATGSGARKEKSLLAARRKVQAVLDTGVIDVFFAEYISRNDDLELIFGGGGVLDQLQDWKASGWVRYAGVTTHDRELARRLAEDSRVDVLMHRFNMAHRKASREVFPTAIRTRTPVVAFTATRWGTLLKPQVDWPDKPPIAADCYRYCLSQQAVHVVLSAPRSLGELDGNLQVLRLPPMSGRECAKWERYGDLVQGEGSHAFETRWP